MSDDSVRAHAWSVTLQGLQFSRDATADTLRVQYGGFAATRSMGPSWPMALRPGEAPIQPIIFLSPGDWVERGMGNLVFLKG